MRVESTNTATRRVVEYRGKEYETGIFKRPSDGPLEISPAGVANDITCDLVNHGGAHKAVYGFSLDHYTHWRKTLCRSDLAAGAFGENLTVSGLDEEAICIGDQLSVGSTILEVSQPRVPCFKLGIALGDERAPALFTRYFHTGVYFRVIQAGEINTGDKLTVTARHPAAVSIYSLFRACHDRDFERGPAVLKAAWNLPELAPEWQEKVAKRCAPKS